MGIPETEEEWLKCGDAGGLIWAAEGRVSVRKLRLFAVAWYRRLSEGGLRLEDSQAVLDLGERLADGSVSEDEQTAQQDIEVAIWGAPREWSVVIAPSRVGVFLMKGWHTRSERQRNSDLARDILGNPFRPVAVDPAWLTPTVTALARGIYDERAFDRLPILADALQDAGCDSADLLDHCRGPGPHARGCWAVDLVLGKQ